MELARQLHALLESIPNQITLKMKGMEELYEETGNEEFKLMATDLKALRKSFYYRRKRYKESEDKTEVSKYMTFVHDTIVTLVQYEQKTLEVLADE